MYIHRHFARLQCKVFLKYTGVAQLVEQWSPKPKVASSILATRAKENMEKLTTYFKESYNELIHKVTWPSWPELQSSSVVVLIATIIIALIIWVMDVASNNLLQRIYNSF